ncbi:MAG: 2-aminoethylphosphonate--pyruvate transaminase [Candidatus Tectomicrobia bacterium]
MELQQDIPESKDKILFTPGPLTTSRYVKQAMLRDLGSRDVAFIECVREIRHKLLTLGGVSADAYTAIPMQGSGTFGVESVFSSTVPPHGKLLLIINGAYGKRMAQMAHVLHLEATTLTYAENQTPDLAAIESALAADPNISDVVMVHCETTTGILNPLRAIGTIVQNAERRYIVDAMSSFGAIPIDIKACGIDYLISSANKCIEGVPGFAFVIARKAALLATEGYARSLSLDLLAQWKGLEADGQFRFTPPTHALIAFHQALLELEAEGGIEGRAQRYRTNYETLIDGMRTLGFQAYLKPEDTSYIITTFHFPPDPHFHFEEFYRRLHDKGYAIYPGKVSDAACFRIGTIGRIFASDVRALLAGIGDTLVEMGVEKMA